MTLSDHHISLFQSLFKGRDDIYARRWVNGEKSGYMPAYDLDWQEFNKHKAQGGTLKTFKYKKLAPVKDNTIKQHLSGKETIGIYPLLKDNTSWFIAADFDGDQWMNESQRFIRTCQNHGIPAYLERSRSGNGAHVWIFFERPVPAWKSRKLALHILRETDILSEFDKEASFDRLFPNQDTHSGAGFGNLIALPLHGKSVTDGNTCFLDPETGEPFLDQWKALKKFKKINQNVLDNALTSFKNGAGFSGEPDDDSPRNLSITLGRNIRLNRSQLTSGTTYFLREELNFANSEFLIKKNLGRSTFGTERYFKLIEESEKEVLIPRGFYENLLDYCRANNVPWQITDLRRKHKSVTFQSDIKLFPYQTEALKKSSQNDFGVIVAPPGSGKTVMGLELVARKKQPALILVHRRQLFDQWMDRIESFLGIPKGEIGCYSGSKKTPGSGRITVAMIQTLSRGGVDQELYDSFGTVIVDECHHVPARLFRETISRISSYYLYGLTATPIRKNNDEDLIYVFIGKILAEVPAGFLDAKSDSTIQIRIKETALQVPFDYRIDDYETLSRILVYDTARNQLIIDDLSDMVEQQKRILLLTERTAHVDVLNLYLKDRFETIAVSGDDSKRSRQSKLEQVKAGHFKILLTTGQFFGEGIDIDRFDCLFLVYPFSFKGKLIQYIGRVTRSDKVPIIYDYRDKKIDYYEKLFQKRNRFYNEIRKAKQMTLGL